MIGDLPKIVITLAIVAVVGMIGLGISQQASETVDFEEGDAFYNTSTDFIQAIADGYSWIPMLILAFVGGVAIAYVARFMGWIDFRQ